MKRYTLNIDFKIDQERIPNPDFFSEILGLNGKVLEGLGFSVRNDGSNNSLIASREQGTLSFPCIGFDWNNKLLAMNPGSVCLVYENAKLSGENGEYLQDDYNIQIRGHVYKLLPRDENRLWLMTSFKEVQNTDLLAEDFSGLAKRVAHALWQSKLALEIVQSFRCQDTRFQDKTIWNLNRSIFQSLQL
ncbi:MAG TPA: hypothetical protein VHQ41_02025 [Patescibacteria group bacterium]|jgi:hypothetical protein|nr:hypothetical protein [Patescibacteria group bacterium]